MDIHPSTTTAGVGGHSAGAETEKGLEAWGLLPAKANVVR
jgi:hypothetical protein